MIAINVNENVRVRLTDRGRAISSAAGLTVTEREGWSDWQMWEMMAIFGPYFANIAAPADALPFATDILFPDRATLRCTGCGTTKTIADIRFTHPNALSCCPERDMQPEAVIIKRLEAENARLRNALARAETALRPFADKGAQIPRHWRGDVPLKSQVSIGRLPTVQDYWNATDTINGDYHDGH